MPAQVAGPKSQCPKFILTSDTNVTFGVPKVTRRFASLPGGLPELPEPC